VRGYAAAQEVRSSAQWASSGGSANAEVAAAATTVAHRARDAVRMAMRAMAEVMREIGWSTPLNALSEQQVLTLTEVAVGAFQDAMRASATTRSEEVPF
jgi:capsid protein